MASAKGSRKDQKKQSSAAKYNRNKKVAIEDELVRNDDLVHKVLSEALVKELVEFTDVKDMQRRLGENFNLEDGALDLREGSILDVYTAAVWWATQNKFSVDETSGFFTIIYRLLENVKDKNLTLVENLVELKKMITSSQNKPELFSVEQCKAVSDYISVAFLHHYKLFEFMFGVQQAQEIIGADLTVEVLPPASLPYPAPLCEAVTQEMYDEYIATPPPSREQSTVVEEATVSDQLLEEDVLSELTLEDVQEIFTEVSTRVLSNVHARIRERITAKENEYLTRINKIHNVLSGV